MEIQSENEDEKYHCMNNFHGLLPGGYMRADFYCPPEELHKKRRDVLKETYDLVITDGTLEEYMRGIEKKYGDLELSQTSAELFATIDQVLVEHGFDLEDIRKRVEAGEEIPDLYIEIYPAYAALLAMGYTEAGLAR